MRDTREARHDHAEGHPVSEANTRSLGWSGMSEALGLVSSECLALGFVRRN